MAIIPSNTFRVWRDGDVVGAEEYMKELEILRMAINANGTDISVLKNATIGVLKGVPNGITFPPNPNPGDVFLRTDEDKYYFLSSQNVWIPLALDADLIEHMESTENPHRVSASQLGVYTKTEADVKFATKALEDWKNASTQNGWYNHQAARPVQYFKDPYGMVHLRGSLAPGVLTNGVTPFILPEGYRPKKEVDIIIKAFSSTNTLTFTTLSIQPNGNCGIYDNMSLNSIRLDNIHFRTDS
jgi:hypothetical protein